MAPRSSGAPTSLPKLSLCAAPPLARSAFQKIARPAPNCARLASLGGVRPRFGGVQGSFRSSKRPVFAFFCGRTRIPAEKRAACVSYNKNHIETHVGRRARDAEIDRKSLRLPLANACPNGRRKKSPPKRPGRHCRSSRAGRDASRSVWGALRGFPGAPQGPPGDLPERTGNAPKRSRSPGATRRALMWDPCSKSHAFRAPMCDPHSKNHAFRTPGPPWRPTFA